jgi:hypothetical protein
VQVHERYASSASLEVEAEGSEEDLAVGHRAGDDVIETLQRQTLELIPSEHICRTEGRSAGRAGGRQGRRTDEQVHDARIVRVLLPLVAEKDEGRLGAHSLCLAGEILERLEIVDSELGHVQGVPVVVAALGV